MYFDTPRAPGEERQPEKRKPGERRQTEATNSASPSGSGLPRIASTGK